MLESKNLMQTELATAQNELYSFKSERDSLLQRINDLEGTMATPEFKSAMQTRTSNINEMNDVFNGSRFISLPNAAPAGGDALDELTNSRVEGENKPPVWKHSVSTGSLHARAAQNILS